MSAARVDTDRELEMAGLGWEHRPRLPYNGCPRRLAGKRHLGGGRCWCNTNLNDHAGRYRTITGVDFVAWEPYGFTADELMPVVEAAGTDGIRVVVDGRSPYYRGVTVALLFIQKEAQG